MKVGKHLGSGYPFGAVSGFSLQEEYGKKLGLEGFEEDTEVVAPNKKGKPKATHKQRESSERPEPVPRECQSPTEELPGLPEVPLSPSGSD